MVRTNDETEALARRREDTPAPERRLPDACAAGRAGVGGPGGPCAWELERSEILRDLRGVRADLQLILQRLAAGSERMRGLADLSSDIEALRGEVTGLQTTVAVLRDTVATLRTIVYGACGTALLAVLGGLLGLVIVKGGAP